MCALLPACDKKEDKKDDKKEEKSDADKELEERLAKKRAAREAEAKAKQDKADAIKALAALPEEMPKDITEACEAVAAAQDEFMKRNFEGEGLARWEEAKGSQLGMVKTSCAKKGSVEIAACQVVAMNNAPPEFAKNLPDILAACIEKFSGEGGEGAEGGETPPAQ